MKQNSTILGVDPGTNLLGYGVIQTSEANLSVVTLGVLKLEKYSDHYQRLFKIFERITTLIDQFTPDQFAIESTFFGKNVQSMLKLGRAQGVCIAAAVQKGLPVYEYSPRRIKQVITGRGAASKEQVSGMLHHQLKFDSSQYALDATDALAVALCHHFAMKAPGGQTSGDNYTGWDAFVKSNPGRVK